MMYKTSGAAELVKRIKDIASHAGGECADCPFDVFCPFDPCAARWEDSDIERIM